MTRHTVGAGTGVVALMAAMLMMRPAVMLAQAPAEGPAFKTVTLTPSMSGEGVRGGVRPEAGGKLAARKATLRQLIQTAYWRHAFDNREIAGEPDWMDSAYFDLAADVGHEHVFDADGFPRETQLMLRRLLAERFKLKIRTENQPRPVYALMLAASGGTLGPQFHKSEIDAAATMKKLIAGERVEKAIGIAAYPGRMVGSSVTIPGFASILSGVVDRPVIDRTGLTGRYNYEFEAVEIKPPGPFGPSYRPSETKESIFTTLPKQLGLKLEPVQGAVEVLVIEHVELPADLRAK
jgi:uncharacterized protein (TIGR03435 family)